MTNRIKRNSTPSRRTVLGLIAAGLGGALLPPGARAAGAGATALAFAGDALVAFAGGGLRRRAGDAAWQDLSAPGSVTALAAAPGRPDALFAGLAVGGVARSADAGTSWQRPGRGLPAAPVMALATSFAAPGTLYAAVADDGLWTSSDDGATWSLAMDRPWIAEAEREIAALASVDIASGMGGIWVYAGTLVGLIRVPDCFCRWQEVVAGDAMEALVTGDAAPPEMPLPAGEPVRALVSCPAAPERLAAALPSGLWTSADAGVNWSRVAPLDAEALAVHPQDPDRLAAIGAGGPAESRDGGATWTDI